jgi:acetyl-CoA C-acetyltransferase
VTAAASSTAPPRARPEWTQVVVVGYARTPIGRFTGALAGLPAVQLGAEAIRGALGRGRVDPGQVDQVLMGHVLQAGQGQLTARQAATRAGIGLEVPAVTVNKVCLSGMAAIALGAQQLLLGEADVVVAGGMESMSNAPHLLPGARRGFRLGGGEVTDALLRDGLWCALEGEHMGAANDRASARHGISRQQQDGWAARSHERAAAAQKDGRFVGEIVPIATADRGPGRAGDGAPPPVAADEGVRPGTSPRALAELPPVFSAIGTTTAGNASQISDGAAALVLARADRARALGLEPLARLLGYGQVAGPDPSLHHQPAAALHRAAQRAGLDPAGFDLYEVNEAFASVVLHSTALLGLDPERVNVNGGAIALGHPIGCSGARLPVTLLHELRRRGGGRGAAALCGGGGQGDALLLETI